MPFNLIENAWLPVRRRSGPVDWIPPWKLTDSHDRDPYISLAWARPDMDGALIQFLIGLVQATLAPSRSSGWPRLLDSPPGPEELAAAFSGLTPFFNLDGDGPRFMQDLDPLAGCRTSDIFDLLIDQPTETAIKDNTDLFVKRSRTGDMCPACASAALFILQTLSPQGGRGHRTGLRGGGPLTTLVLGQTLWQTVWLAVLPEREFFRLAGPGEGNGPETRFPWTGPTRTSDNNEITGPTDIHPDQYYWAMPRRIRLEDPDRTGRCGLCGRNNQPLFTAYRTKNLGTNYDGPFQHPLSPHARGKDGAFLPVHGQPGGLTYRHWLGLVQTTSDRTRRPAAVVSRFLNHRDGPALFQTGHRDLRLAASGYDLDKAKARQWIDSRMPLILVDEKARTTYEAVIEQLIATADLTAWGLNTNLRAAWFNEGDDRRKKRVPSVDARFWNETEAGFYQTLGDLKELAEDGMDVISPETAQLKTDWLNLLRRCCLSIFDDLSQADQLDRADPKRIVRARRSLGFFVSLANKKTARSLGLEAAGTKRGKK